MDERDALLALNAIEGIGNARINNITETFGSPEEVFQLSPQQLAESAILPADVIKNLTEFPVEDFLNKEKGYLLSRGITFLTIYDPEYPELLKEIPDAPSVIYIKGEIPDNEMSVAIVGSRKSSFYGQTTATVFAERLGELGITIVSGLARGIDTAAHQGALRVGGKTVAVLGCGLAHIYPPENKQLFERVAKQGAVISEFPIHTPPVPYNFPRRNRIISGLSLGVIVVEAALKSGALITSDCALEQGREVFAVPGKIDNPASQGVHHLIKQGAKLVSSIEDVLEELKVALTAQVKASAAKLDGEREKNNLENLTERQHLVYNHISSTPKHIDELALLSCTDIKEMSKVLFDLQSQRLIRQLPGNLFSKLEK